MTRKFPYIQTLADVLPAVEGRDEILVADRGTHTVVNYLVVFDDTFPPLKVAGGSAKQRAERELHYNIRRECRGMIFDRDGKIIRRPLHKFFNVNEREETLARNIDLSQPHIILEKLDGSSISPMRIDGEIKYGTRMGPTEIGDQAAKHAALNPGYDHLFQWCELFGLTPIYEWCSRSQRIVIDHPEDRLVLLAARHLYSGDYLEYHHLARMCKTYGIPVVQPLGIGHTGSTDALVDMIRALPMDKYGEGVVIWLDGEAYKLKSDEYCLIHKAKERITEERHVVMDIINGDIDDVMATVLEDDRKNIERFRAKFWEGVGEYYAKLFIKIQQRHKQFPDRKKYALSDEQKSDTKFETRSVFWFYDTPVLLPTVRQYVIDNRIRPGCSSRVKLGEMKDEVYPNTVFKY